MLIRIFSNLSLGILFVLSFCASATAQSDRPNIIWITIEDTSPFFIGSYGNQGVKTPNLDQLAKESVRYTNANSTNTVCAPSRFTILTGVRSSAAGTGNHRTHYAIPKEITGFPYLLKKSGYYTTNNVKTDYNIANAKELTAANWNESSNKASYRNRKAGQPFFAVFNFTESHQSRSMTNPWEVYEKDVLNNIPENERATPDEVIVPPFYRDSPEMRKHMVRLYNSIHYMDMKVGELIAKIKADGEWDNTIIFFFGDHGQGIPGFKTHASSLGHKVPFLIRVPERYQNLIPATGGTINDEPVNFEDLAPTMLSLTGVPVPDYMKGTVFLGNKKTKAQPYFWGARDNTDEVIDMGRTVIQDSLVYIRIYYPYLATIQPHKYMDVSDIMKQIRSDEREGKLTPLQASVVKPPRSAEYLFNTKQDPWETNNLIANPAYQSRLIALRKANQERILSVRDIQFAPDYVLEQINRTDTLYHFRQSEEKYPLKEIVAAAELVGKGTKQVGAQVKLLKNRNAIVRYWAVVGLRSQQAGVLDEKLLSKTLATETEPFVQIELAVLLFTHFNNLAAEKILLAYLENSDATLVRQSLRALVNSGRLNKRVTDNAIALRTKIADQPFKTLNYEVNSSIDLIMSLAGLEKLAREN